MKPEVVSCPWHVRLYHPATTLAAILALDLGLRPLCLLTMRREPPSALVRKPKGPIATSSFLASDNPWVNFREMMGLPGSTLGFSGIGH